MSNIEGRRRHTCFIIQILTIPISDKVFKKYTKQLDFSSTVSLYLVVYPATFKSIRKYDCSGKGEQNRIILNLITLVNNLKSLKEKLS